MKLALVISTSDLNASVDYLCGTLQFTCTHKSDNGDKNRIAIIRPFQSDFYIKLIECKEISKYQHIKKDDRFLGLDIIFEDRAAYNKFKPKDWDRFDLYELHATENKKEGWILFKDPDEYRMYCSWQIDDLEKAAAVKDITEENKWTSIISDLDFQLRLRVRSVHDSALYYEKFGFKPAGSFISKWEEACVVMRSDSFSGFSLVLRQQIQQGEFFDAFCFQKETFLGFVANTETGFDQMMKILSKNVMEFEEISSEIENNESYLNAIPDSVYIEVTAKDAMINHSY